MFGIWNYWEPIEPGKIYRTGDVKNHDQKWPCVVLLHSLFCPYAANVVHNKEVQKCIKMYFSIYLFMDSYKPFDDDLSI